MASLVSLSSGDGAEVVGADVVGAEVDGPEEVRLEMVGIEVDGSEVVDAEVAGAEVIVVGAEVDACLIDFVCKAEVSRLFSLK